MNWKRQKNREKSINPIAWSLKDQYNWLNVERAHKLLISRMKEEISALQTLKINRGML